VKRGPGDALQRDVVAEEESVAKGLIVGELLRTREYPPERERRILDELEVFQKRGKGIHIPYPNAQSGQIRLLGGRRTTHLAHG
jgi:hypothetical protein